MSPIEKRYAPMCCPDNIAHGFVLAAIVHHRDGDYGETTYGTDWSTTLVDAVGIAHVTKITRCPSCGTLLFGLPHVAVDAWSAAAEKTASRAVDEAVRKVREAQAALERAAKEDKR